MRSINRALALAAAVLTMAAAGSANAAWGAEENGPHPITLQRTNVALSDEPISLAPKNSVSHQRSFVPARNADVPTYAVRRSTTKPFNQYGPERSDSATASRGK